jgi:hypothetical protein
MTRAQSRKGRLDRRAAGAPFTRVGWSFGSDHGRQCPNLLVEGDSSEGGEFSTERENNSTASDYVRARLVGAMSNAGSAPTRVDDEAGHRTKESKTLCTILQLEQDG